MISRWTWLAAILWAVASLAWANTRDRWWQRIDDVCLFADGNRVAALKTYQNRDGRVILVTEGSVLMSDNARSSLGVPQGGVWFSSDAIAFGVSADAMLVPIGKSDASWEEVELRGVALKNGRILARVRR